MVSPTPITRLCERLAAGGEAGSNALRSSVLGGQNLKLALGPNLSDTPPPAARCPLRSAVARGLPTHRFSCLASRVSALLPLCETGLAGMLGLSRAARVSSGGEDPKTGRLQSGHLACEPCVRVCSNTSGQ